MVLPDPREPAGVLAALPGRVAVRFVAGSTPLPETTMQVGVSFSGWRTQVGGFPLVLLLTSKQTHNRWPCEGW